MFNVELIGLFAENNIDYYKYEVIWSVPTKSYPVPQVMVSVFFHVAVNLDYPAHYPVDVSSINIKEYRYNNINIHELRMIILYPGHVYFRSF